MNPSGKSDSSELELAASGRAFAKRVAAGLGSSAIGQGVQGLQTIVLVPFFLRAWGPSLYGRWLVLTAVIAYLSLLDLGGQIYFGNLLAFHYARKEYEEYRQTLATGVSVVSAIGLVAYAILALTVWGASRPLFGRNAPLLMHWQRVVLLVLGAQFLLISIPSGVYVQVYRTVGRYARGQMVGNGMRSGGILVFALALWFRVSPAQFAVITFVYALVTLTVVVVDTRRNIPVCRGVRLSVRYLVAGRSHLGGALHFWLLSLAQSINQQSGVLILGAFVGGPAVATFYTHRTVANVPGYVGAVGQAPMLSELTLLHARERRAELRRTAIASIRANTIATGLLAAVLWVAVPVLYPAWTGRTLALNNRLLAVLLLQAVLQAGWATAAWSLLAANKHHTVARLNVMNALLTAGLGVALVREHGAVGVAAASLIADVVLGLAIVPGLAASFLEMSRAQVYRAVVFALVLVVAGGLVLAGVNAYHNVWAWLALLLVGIIGAALTIRYLRTLIRVWNADDA